MTDLTTLLDAADPSALRSRLLGLVAGDAPHPDLLTAAEFITRMCLSNPSRAVECCDRALAASTGLDGPTARFLAARAFALCYAGRLADARADLDSARTLAATMPGHVWRATIEHAAIQPLARAGSLEDAAQCALAAIDAYSAAGEHARAARVRMNLGILVRMQGNPGAALEHFNAIASMLRSDPMTLGALESNRAEALLDLDRFADAEQSFDRALQAFKSCDNHHAAAIVEGNLADLLSRVGRISEAIERFESARRAFERSGALADVARLGIEEAEALASIGAPAAAADLYRASIGPLAAAGLQRELARARLGFGRLLLASREASHAIASIREARLTSIAIGDRLLAAECDLLLNGLEAPSAELPAPASAHAKLLANYPIRLAALLVDLAHYDLDAGRAAHALRAADAARDALSQCPVAPALARAEHARALALKGLARPAEALVAARQALDHAERFRSSLRSRHLASIAGGAWHTIYDHAALAALDSDPDPVPSAFDALERRQLRWLLASASHDLAASHLDGPGLQHLHSYEACLRELTLLYERAANDDAPEPASLRTTIDRAERDADLWRRRLHAARPEFVPAIPTQPFEAIQAAIPPHAALVFFVHDASHLTALVVQHDRSDVLRRFAPLDRVSALLDRLQLSVTARALGRQTPEVDALALNLSSLVWDPLRRLLNRASLVAIFGDGLAEEIPWTLLTVRAGDAHAITLAASATTWLHPPHVPDPVELASTPVLVVGVPDEHAPHALDEAHAIASLWPHSTLLLENHATADNVLRLAAESPIVHLAAHATFGRLHPLSSRIRFADRWVTARELARAVRPGSTWILGGCETGRCRAANAAAFGGLASSLTAAHAGAVLSTLWPLNDAFSLPVMSQFHLQLASGHPPHKALRYIATSADQHGFHPLDWGSFALRGTLA